MILECDIGNSRCKWRLKGSDKYFGSFDYRKESFDIFARLGAEIGAVSAVHVCAVAKSDVVKQFSEACEKYFSCRPRLARTTRECAGVRNAYADVTRLGVDRWAAMIAAFKRCQGAVLVIDAGSAMTVDVVDDKGLHLGGYIIPGYRLMSEALLAETAQVQFDAAELQLSFGNSTQEAVGAGITAALVGSIQQSFVQAQKLLGKDYTVLITGGDAERLLGLLDRPVEMVPNLVLDGIEWLLANTQHKDN